MNIRFRVLPDQKKVVGKGESSLGTHYKDTSVCHNGDEFNEELGKKTVTLKIKRKQARLSKASKKAILDVYKREKKEIDFNISVITGKIAKIDKDIESLNARLVEIGGKRNEPAQ